MTRRTTAVAPLQVGPLSVWPPVVLAPMAGITNAPFRRLCQGFIAEALDDVRLGAEATSTTDATPTSRPDIGGPHGRSAAGSGPGRTDATPTSRPDIGGSDGIDGVATAFAGGTEPPRASPATSAGLFVSEMITARGLAERNEKTLRMARFADDEPVRSIQLYGTEPGSMREAARFLTGDERADHIDLNFGCPVAKVTRKGGGAALPVHRALFRDIVRAAVQGAGDVPVTVKMRIGVDDRLTTYLEAGRIARDEGAAAVALHARTAEQHYSGRADWRAIAELRHALPDVPVLGNGDIWQAADALRMLQETGCDGVVVGRGCLGRPWLFGDLARAFAGREVPSAPPLAEAMAVLRRHVGLLAEWLGPDVAVRDIRKHVGWYLQGYPVGGQVRRQLTTTSTVAELDDALAELTAGAPDLRIVDGADARPRGKTSGPISIALPAGWLAAADDPAPVIDEELEAVSGG